MKRLVRKSVRSLALGASSGLLLALTASPAVAQPRILVYGAGVTAAQSGVADPRGYFPAGSTVDIVNAAPWAALTTAQYGSYDAIWVDADVCSTSGNNLNTLLLSQAAWGPAVSGRVVIVSSDPILHAPSNAASGLGARALMRNSAAWVTGAGRSASGGSTGMYLSYGCRNAAATSTETVVSAFTQLGVGLAVNRARNAEVATITAPGMTHPVLNGIVAAGGTANLTWSQFCHGTFTAIPTGWDALTTCVSAPAGELGSLVVRDVVCRPPTVTGNTVNEGGTTMLSAMSANTGALIYSWDLDNNGTFETVGQTVAFSAATLDGPGMASVRVRVTGGSCGLTSAELPVVVTVNNVAPTFTSMPPAMASPLVAYSYSPAVTDPAGVRDPLTFRLVSGPPGMTIAANGTVSWTPTAAQMGQPFVAEIEVSDGDGGVTTQRWTITVGMLDSDGDGVPDITDADSDNDGIPDIIEGNGRDPSRDTDGDGIFDYLDRDFAGFVDANMDGVDDRVDLDGDGIPNHLDLDSDGDGIFDVLENGTGALDANRDGRIDGAVDVDRDGLLASVDTNDNDRTVITARTMAIDTDRDGRIDSLDTDDDGDGVPTRTEVGSGGQYMPRNTDGTAAPGVTVDTIPDYLDTDDDGDGLLTADELGAGGAAAPRNSDAVVPAGQGTSDALPDYLDADDDGDSIPTAIERALAGMTPDLDMDMLPAWLDRDSDGDTVFDVVEAGAVPSMPANSDMDADRDFLDLDSDNDCVPDRDAREAGAARTNPAIPQMNVNNNCANPTPVCAIATGLCSADVDTDMDGIPDLTEIRNGTNPNNPDTDGDGVPDGREVGAGPGFVPFDTDMDGIIDALDPDDDGDGVPTRDELGPGGFMMPRNTDAMVPAGFGTSDMRPDYLDPDDDGDGIPTRVENTLEGMGGAPDMDMVPAYLDLDSDGDGIPDAIEAGTDPTMPRNSDGTDRPDFLDLDSDNDTVDDQTEAGPMPLMPRNSNAMVPAGQGMSNMLPDYIDPDDDGDGIPTAVEVRLEGMIAGDSDMIPAFLDLDSDGDGVPDSLEAGADPTMPANSDGMPGMGDRPDFLDTDSDNDCLPDSDPREAGAARTDATMPSAMADNNCMAPTNICNRALGRCVSPEDSDGDGIPDVDERRIGTDPMNPDTDMDGVPDGAEVGPGPGFMPRDTDMDGMIDALDPDDDGDGVPTRDELGPGGFMMPRNTDAMVPAGMGMSDMLPDYLDDDDDGDRIPTRLERMLEGDMPVDMDGVPAYLDLDSDGDGVPDSVEAGPEGVIPTNSDAPAGAGDRPDFLDLDSDNDCVPDSDPREAGTARTNPEMPSMMADDNCMMPTPVCDRAVGVCVARPSGDAGVSDSGTDASVSMPDGGRADAGAMDAGFSGVISGAGACACTVPASQGGSSGRTASALALLGGLALVYGSRRSRRRSAR